jgi:nucleoid-associated protein YgaU
MTATSMSRMVLLAFVAACGIPLVLAVQHFRREPPVDNKAATAASAVSKPAPGAQYQGPAALAAAQADAVAADLAGSPVPPDSEGGVPAFDVARIEPTGEAVIAGRATPGATVELLRNGELHDRAVADQSGQFVMVPPRLPSGTYDLTLRSKQPDGKQATSSQTVAVALEPSPTDRPVAVLMTPGRPTVVLSQPAAPKPMAGAVVVPHTGVTGSARAQATASKRPDLAAAQERQLAAAGAPVLPDRGSPPSTVVVPKIATTTVSRGDSLWRLSRLTYGAGTRYAVIYKANREQIRNPNLIHPGQIFVLPAR